MTSPTLSSSTGFGAKGVDHVVFAAHRTGTSRPFLFPLPERIQTRACSNNDVEHMHDSRLRPYKRAGTTHLLMVDPAYLPD